MNQTISIGDPDVTAVQTSCRAAALLVDGENLPSRLAERLIVGARRILGPLAVLRVYGNAALLNGWAEAPGFRLVHAHSGKNITDMLLTVEAMELSYAGRIDGFAIATSDRDFAPLAWSLRSRGFPAILLSPERASEQLRKAFTAHVKLAVERETAPVPTPPDTPPPPVMSPDTPPGVDPSQMVLAVLGGKALPLKDFAAQMKIRGITKPKNTNWRKYLEPFGAPVAFQGQGPATTIRLLSGKDSPGA